MDYGDVIAPIMANPGDSQACLNIEINNDSLIEERQECLMVSFIAEPLVNLEIGINSSVCCIVDDDSKWTYDNLRIIEEIDRDINIIEKA